MFKHSIKVPRLYKLAAKIAKDVKEGVGSIKQLVYENKSKHPNIKAIYALVATLFQRSDEVDNLLKRSQLLLKEPRSDPWLTKILIVELLWGKKSLPGNSKPENTVLAYEQIFKAHISDMPIASKDNDPDEKEDLKPRYVRVNTLHLSLNEALDGFREEGWILSKFLDKTDYKGFLDKITSLSNEEFLVDIHIPNLLIFPPKTRFYNHPAYKNGSIILQDKASCLPVHILSPPPGSVVLDMCAAPGMKTTHVAAAINNEGKVYAVERDPRRFETLDRIIEQSGATCVTTVNKDVLTCTDKDFPGVQYILVDPSCSGSGITGRLDFEQSKSNERMEKLAGFQIKILRSALTRFPDAKRVVYSTCSVFPEENEDVVRQVLETNSTFKLVPATKFVNNTWKNFGSPEYGDIGSYCLYAKPNVDFTNGFFVAVFERLEEGEENTFFNTRIYNFKKHVQNQEKRKRRQQQQFYENADTFQNSTDDQNLQQGYGVSTEISNHTLIENHDNDTAANNIPGGKNKKKTSDCISEDTDAFSNNDKVNIGKKRKSHSVNEIDSVSYEISIKQENESANEDLSGSGKRKNKKKKRKNSHNDVSGDVIKSHSANEINSVSYEISMKQENESANADLSGSGKSKKKKKKRKHSHKDVSADVIISNDSIITPDVEHMVKKEKSIAALPEYGSEIDVVSLETERVSKKKKKKSKSDSHRETQVEKVTVKKKKRKKHE